MRYLKYAVLVGLFVVVAGAGTAQAQVAVQFGPAYVGPPPVCAYGYYEYPPYECAPYGYYGRDYYDGGVFIGAGLWLNGYYGRGSYGGWGGYYGGRGWYGDRGGF